MHQLSLTDPDMSQVAQSDLRGASSAAESKGAAPVTPLEGLFVGELTLRASAAVKTEAASSAAGTNSIAAAAIKSEEAAAHEAPAQSGGQSTPQADTEATVIVKVESSSLPAPPDTDVRVFAYQNAA